MNEYYVRTQISEFNTETNRWELKDRFMVLYKNITFGTGDGDSIIKPEGFEPDRVNQLIMYEDFSENGFRMELQPDGSYITTSELV